MPSVSTLYPKTIAKDTLRISVDINRQQDVRFNKYSQTACSIPKHLIRELYFAGITSCMLVNVWSNNFKAAIVVRRCQI